MLSDNILDYAKDALMNFIGGSRFNAVMKMCDAVAPGKLTEKPKLHVTQLSGLEPAFIEY